MENKINNNSTAAVEKVSLKQIKQEKESIAASEDKVVTDLINAVLALNEEELDMAIAFVNKKLEKLEKLNKK